MRSQSTVGVNGLRLRPTALEAPVNMTGRIDGLSCAKVLTLYSSISCPRFGPYYIDRRMRCHGKTCLLTIRIINTPRRRAAKHVHGLIGAFVCSLPRIQNLRSGPTVAAFSRMTRPKSSQNRCHKSNIQMLTLKCARTIYNQLSALMCGLNKLVITYTIAFTTKVWLDRIL